MPILRIAQFKNLVSHADTYSAHLSRLRFIKRWGLMRNAVEEDVEQLTMSTLSFQDYVRERMLRRRNEVALDSDDQALLLAEWRMRPQAPKDQRR